MIVPVVGNEGALEGGGSQCKLRHRCLERHWREINWIIYTYSDFVPLRNRFYSFRAQTA